jgi:hypothetical protein
MIALSLIVYPLAGLVRDLPSTFDGYFTFSNIDLDCEEGSGCTYGKTLGGHYDYHVQGPTTSVAPSGAMVTTNLNNNQVLKAICSTSTDACHFFNTCDARMGFWTKTDSNTTYLKNTTGTVENDDIGGHYLHVTNADTYCTSYTGWALPASMVKTQCDQDSTCSGFKMRNDDSFGWLCKMFAADFDTWLRLSSSGVSKAVAP